ncbi:MAG: translation initiation factor IF-2 [Candidatus Diapherotrites archaeon]|nr:translation initiation factor IF-2 [Candidatus Diapherotrites archaeon]
METIRQPIVVVLAHVDHGKTTLLDKIRGTAIAKKEPGQITQHVGATVIPREVIENLCGPQLAKMGVKLTIPGLLFIDTPGHEAFTNLRKRGGGIADLAVLLIDINEGIQPQTKESIEILKSHKTPFIIAANKIDMLFGWQSLENRCFMESYKSQTEQTRKLLDDKLYELMGQLHKLGFATDRFDQVTDFTKTIAIIPISGRTGEGLPELLMLISGLTQKFMGDRLESKEGPGRATILEVKELQGLGSTVDVIVYKGSIKQGDTIVLGGKNGPIVTKIRALLQPKPLQEIREGKKFEHVKEVHASAGVKINAPSLEDALPGSGLFVAEKPGDIDKLKEEIAEELEQTQFSTDATGVILKADALGSLEAIISILKKDGVPIRKAGVGSVTKKDIIEASSVKEENKLLGVVLAFNTGITEEAKKEAEDLNVEIISTNVIYKLLDDYTDWKKEEKEKEKRELLESATYPAKIQILPGYVFRKSKPAIVGIEIIDGILKSPCPLMDAEGKRRGKVKEIQDKKEVIPKAEKGMQVAVAIEGVTIGRQVNEGDILYSHIPLERVYKLEEEVEEKQLIEEIKKIKKKVKLDENGSG